MPNIQVEVNGVPVPQGSKRAFRAGNRLVVVDQQGKDLRTYREAIAYEVAKHIREPLRGAVTLQLDFLFARPRGHYGKKGLLPSAPEFKTTKPDLDKLVRSVMDALTGVAYLDDAQVRHVQARKDYITAGVPGTYVLVEWDE